MENFSLNEVMEQAVQTEKVGFRFYTEWAGKFTSHPKIKELFTALAENEKVHEKRFTELKETAQTEGDADWEEVSKYLRALVESEFFLGSEKALSGLSQVSSVAEAVKAAIGFEKETLLYFYAMRDLVKDKEAVDKIIAEEKSHILSLSNLARSL